MPELPEMETARRVAERALVGRRIDRVRVSADPIVFESVGERVVVRRLTGATITGTGRRGKHVWLALDRRPWVVFHFGMTGAFHTYASEADRPRFWKIEFRLETGEFFAMTNARRLGRVRLRDDPEREPPIAGLGPDPLIDLPDAATLAARWTRRRAPIKALLLDQSAIAGVGNWIADEVLYQAKIAPRRPADRLTIDDVRRLRSTIVRVCRRACDVEADADRFPRTWLFHVRWGKRATHTRRGEKIRYDEVGGRTTAWVPSVQR